MYRLLIFVISLLIYSDLIAQSSNLTAVRQVILIYNPEADAKKELAEAIKKAGAEGKHVLIQVGGNWCSWCIKFHKFIHENASVDSLIKKDFVFLLINYSKEKPENKNLDVLKQLGYPQRFGFPVLLILDEKGNRLHTQDSGFLESGGGYDINKVMTFLKCWTPAALRDDTYKK